MSQERVTCRWCRLRDVIDDVRLNAKRTALRLRLVPPPTRLRLRLERRFRNEAGTWPAKAQGFDAVSEADLDASFRASSRAARLEYRALLAAGHSRRHLPFFQSLKDLLVGR